MRSFPIFFICVALALPTATTARELSKKEQQRDEQKVAKEDKAKEDKAKEDKAKEDKAKEDKAKGGRIVFDMTAQTSSCGFQGSMSARMIPKLMRLLDQAQVETEMRELNNCVSKDKARLAELYPEVAKGLADKPEALKALKRYYAFWESSMDALYENVTNGERTYERVKNENTQKLNDLYNQYQLELR